MTNGETPERKDEAGAGGEPELVPVPASGAAPEERPVPDPEARAESGAPAAGNPANAPPDDASDLSLLPNAGPTEAGRGDRSVSATPPADEPAPAARGPSRAALVAAVPLGVGRLLAWPFSGGQGFAFLGGVFLLGIVLLAAWVAGLVWWPFRLAVALPGAVWFLAYPGRALIATAGRAGAPPDWPPLARGSPAWREGLLTLLVLLVCGAPPLALALATDSLWWGLAGAVLVWTLTPAALLGFWLGGRLRYANPLLALRIALGGGRRYLLCLLPGLPWLVTRLLLGGESIYGVVLEGCAFVGLVLTAHLLGRLANESAGVRDRVETIRSA